MTTHTEKRLLTLSNKRQRLMARLHKAVEGHKATRDIQAKLVETTAAQIRAELRIERKRNVA